MVRTTISFPDRRISARLFGLFAWLAFSVSGWAEQGIAEAVREYLYAEPEQKPALLNQIPAYDGDPIEMVRRGIKRSYENRERGSVRGDEFELPHLRERYPGENFASSILVPESYDPAEQTGLLLCRQTDGLHPDVDPNYIIVVTSPQHRHRQRARKPWWTPESDAYYLAVIEEASYRYNIDPDRIYWWGHSEGMIGALHMAQTVGDRFAVIGGHAGSWEYGFWEGLHGVMLYITHGVHDAMQGIRARHTDIAHARFASAALAGYDIPHIYREHEACHIVRPDWIDREFLTYIKQWRRDPHPPIVVTASRKGKRELQETPDFFWLTIEETTAGNFRVDRIRRESQNKFHVRWWIWRHMIETVPGGTLHARLHDDNFIEIETRNIRRLTVWLHPGMVDFDRPVRINIDGDIHHDTLVPQSLVAALQSYDRRRDEGMLFAAKLTFSLE